MASEEASRRRDPPPRRRKRAKRHKSNAVADLRRGRDDHVAFARENPAIYALMFPQGTTPPSRAAQESADHLRAGFDQLEAHGVLRPGVTAELACRALSAALHGVTAAITRDPRRRDNTRLSKTVREAMVSAC